MNKATINALTLFPLQLESHYAAFPAAYRDWTPSSWDGIPSEQFSALGQLCHVRDIEVDGYHVRFERTLREDHPLLPSIDSDALALQRGYATANADDVLASFRQARERTVELIAGLSEAQLARTAQFEGYGPVSLRSLVHYLCSHDQQHLAGLQWLLGKVGAER
jgi:hypothetical protein